ncbi:glycosyltransferase family 4 protein [Natronobacterium gregoryi]|uniref:Glycosyltransferase n=3 Tax=Natronobacterium gregoryi TaxID=44930 RepID=L0AMW9_NATGS|nr:glycosyltransferase family 4 protein [Natronobacterium gregoryi]AFZ74425.1 glycosyltransferase [Natronobacterium gregoryi SP2]ELY72115.1 group 1 glycosyl transferase [Natronobacterium gregoryi SP2]PLK19754.1 glycosyltransferase family 1 protein [Natronobacterium gregoryi SP2]SFJ40737.1 Glycosyltransferase involved in cell wall bisynthesis [Natronobacterium gregoryi]
MHVGLVVYGDLEETSGGFRYDRRLVESLRARGDTVEVVSLPWRSLARGVFDGWSRSIRSRLDRPVDVLLQDELCHPSLWYHNRRLERPEAVVALIHHLQSDDPTTRRNRLHRPFERRYLESVDATIATSEFTRQRAAKIVPSLADRPGLVASPAGRAGGGAVTKGDVVDRAHDGPLRVTFVGNVVPRKDPLTLVSAFASERATDDWQLTIVGSHDDRGYVKRVRDRVASLGLTDQVTLTGEVPTPRLESILEGSHCLCVPSRYEAFGMVYLEAMEYGVVPIATENGGPREFVDHGTSGVLVDPGDSRAIATALERLDTDRDRLATLGVSALEGAREHPTWDETMRSVRSFLQRVATP